MCLVVIASSFAACSSDKKDNSNTTTAASQSTEAAKNDKKETTTKASDPTELVGKWSCGSDELSFVYTFNKDGTGSYEYSKHKESFTYEVKDNKMVLTYVGKDSKKPKLEQKYTIKENSLIVTDSSGDDIVYTKQK